MDEAASKKRVGLYTMSDEMRALEEQFDKYGKRKEEALAEGNLRKAKTNNTKQKTVLEKLEEQRKLWEQKKAVSRGCFFLDKDSGNPYQPERITASAWS